MKSKIAVSVAFAIASVSAAHATTSIREGQESIGIMKDRFDNAYRDQMNNHNADQRFGTAYNDLKLSKGGSSDISHAVAVAVTVKQSAPNLIPNAVPQTEPKVMKAPVAVEQRAPQLTPTAIPQSVPQPMKAPVAVEQRTPALIPNEVAQSVPQPMKAPVAVEQRAPQLTPTAIPQSVPQPMKAPVAVEQRTPALIPNAVAQSVPQPMKAPLQVAQRVPMMLPQTEPTIEAKPNMGTSLTVAKNLVTAKPNAGTSITVAKNEVVAKSTTPAVRMLSTGTNEIRAVRTEERANHEWAEKRMAETDSRIAETKLAQSKTNAAVANNSANIANHENRIQTLESETNSKFANLDQKIDDNRKRASAGIAGVAAMANIPQVTDTQNFSVGAGAGNTDGESALAVGFSARASQNVVVKGSVSNDTQHNFVVGAGVSYGW